MGHNDNLDLYKFYYTDLKSLSESYFGFVFSMSIAILTVIGWFITSEKAQKVFIFHKHAFLAFTISSILTAIGEGWVVYKIYYTGCKMICIIGKYSGELGICKSEFEFKRPTELTFIILYVNHLLLFGVLIFVLNMIRKKSNQKTENSN